MKKSPKQTYKVKNWSEYNKSLKQRGSLTFWIEVVATLLVPQAGREVIDEWENTEKTGRRGASNKYSDLAIKTMVTIKVLYRLPGRQAQGFLESINEDDGYQFIRSRSQYSITATRQIKNRYSSKVH